jgi:hypothetical protein
MSFYETLAHLLKVVGILVVFVFISAFLDFFCQKELYLEYLIIRKAN